MYYLLKFLSNNIWGREPGMKFENVKIGCTVEYRMSKSVCYVRRTSVLVGS